MGGRAWKPGAGKPPWLETISQGHFPEEVAAVELLLRGEDVNCHVLTGVQHPEMRPLLAGTDPPACPRPRPTGTGEWTVTPPSTQKPGAPAGIARAALPRHRLGLPSPTPCRTQPSPGPCPLL